jgi:hypothetical protein
LPKKMTTKQLAFVSPLNLGQIGSKRNKWL